MSDKTEKIKLKDFQTIAIAQLHEKMKCKRDIVFQSPTGSGKTIMLSRFVLEHLSINPGTVFVWLTPGQGKLEEQSKEKMDDYIERMEDYIAPPKTKLLEEVMDDGFASGDCCFINWEKLNRGGVIALKDSERKNLLDRIQEAFANNLCFRVIVDEAHHNDTPISDEIINNFQPDKILRSTATPGTQPDVFVDELSVISEGLIKRLISVNEGFPQRVETEDNNIYLLERGLEKQDELRRHFRDRGKNINPLIVVQLPADKTDTDSLLDPVEHFFREREVPYAVWLTKCHKNLDRLEEKDADQVAVIIKQAVAQGWDCPRAYILVKLRENMDETFEIQTIGRIRRMPEGKHYSDAVLDRCYLYTFDSKFLTGARKYGASDLTLLELKPEYKKFSLTKEQRAMVTDVGGDSDKALEAITQYFKDEFKLCPGKNEEIQADNRTKLETKGFKFSLDVESRTISGDTVYADGLSRKKDFNDIFFVDHVRTHGAGGQAFLHNLSEIGKKIGMSYDDMKNILFRLFCGKKEYYDKNKFTSLDVRSMYAFVANNVDILRHICIEAMAKELKMSPALVFRNISETEFKIPQKTLFAYNGDKLSRVCKKNVYEGYLLSEDDDTYRSGPELLFEVFCEDNPDVDWFYKNGDKGDEYFSIVYEDNSSTQKLFYPDYILSIKGTVWIIETKGGFRRGGESDNLDVFAEKKFNSLKVYLQKHPELKGGFVRPKWSGELLIATEKYTETQSDAWKSLGEVLKNL